VSEEEAFEKLTELDMKGSLPKVLVLDLFLGEDSGIDVLREVKKHFPSIGVVVYSMYSNPGIVSLVLENGADGFVSKASHESELVAAIKDVFAGKTHIQESLVEPLHTYKNIFMCLTKKEQAVLNQDFELAAEIRDREKALLEKYGSIREDAITEAPTVTAADIAAAVIAHREIHDGNRHLIDRPVVINEIIEDRIDQAGEAENQHYSIVMDNELQFVYEDAPCIADPSANI
jgi:CheY-like chemotaxis protein